MHSFRKRLVLLEAALSEDLENLGHAAAAARAGGRAILDVLEAAAAVLDGLENLGARHPVAKADQHVVGRRLRRGIGFRLGLALAQNSSLKNTFYHESQTVLKARIYAYQAGRKEQVE